MQLLEVLIITAAVKAIIFGYPINISSLTTKKLFGLVLTILKNGKPLGLVPMFKIRIEKSVLQKAHPESEVKFTVYPKRMLPGIIVSRPDMNY